MKYLLLVGVIFIINYTTGRGYYNQQRIHLTTLEVGEFCAKMLKNATLKHQRLDIMMIFKIILEYSSDCLNRNVPRHLAIYQSLC